ncbi:glucokinase [Catalinimonas alkaloidigena]|uniref:Glucokinase n=1 Tax=Catalinimonas alkaloidigena TaxID=1075417 RepID=A0A1G9NYV9_9BACT|nr:glucokinase [Catalinimonas alkaloidigena]SDL91589.1 glucokinase [Catalinimonas alkaloidigena]
MLDTETLTSVVSVPVAFPSATPFCGNVLAVDVGGTKTDVALVRFAEGRATPLAQHTYASAAYASLIELLDHFRTMAPAPDRLSLGVAGPVVAGKAQTTNLPWTVDAAQLSQHWNGIPVSLLNDLEASAYGLAALPAHDFAVLCPGTPSAEGNAAILSPGTGLGEAGLFWDGERYRPFPTEGGHADFAPRTEQDARLWRYLREQFGHVSWERLVSGPGLVNIYTFLKEVERRPVPAWLADHPSDASLAKAISEGAMRQQCPICLETMQLFVHYLAQEAANLVLKLKATGGLFIGGGIVPRIRPLVTPDAFLPRFLQVGRLRPLLEKVPVYVVLNQQTALWGAAQYGAHAVPSE